RSSRPLAVVFRLAFRARLALLSHRRADHAFELQTVGVEKVDGIVALAVVRIVGRRIDHPRLHRLQHIVELVDVAALGELERIMVKADIADAMRMLQALGIGLADPEQRLAVAPSGMAAVLVFEREAETAQHAIVEALGLREIRDADHQMVDTDHTRHRFTCPIKGGAGNRAKRACADEKFYPGSGPPPMRAIVPCAAATSTSTPTYAARPCKAAAKSPPSARRTPAYPN